MRIRRSSGEPDLLVWTTSLLNGGNNPSYRVVTIFNTSRRDEIHRSMLASRFHFTPAEMRLAEQVLAGCSPGKAAENLGVTIHTVRTYLKRLYHKAGVRSQAGLVMALMKAMETLPEDMP